MNQKLLAECNGVRWYVVDREGKLTHMIEDSKKTHHIPYCDTWDATDRFGSLVLSTIKDGVIL